MTEIFLLQLLAVGLGGLSTAWASQCYNRARIGGRLHAFWVSSSTAAICLPVVAWTAIVFFGPGMLGQAIAGTLVGGIFLWVYRNLPYPRPVATSSLCHLGTHTEIPPGDCTREAIVSRPPGGLRNPTRSGVHAKAFEEAE